MSYAGRWLWMAFIAVIWLSVPVSGFCLLRIDRDRFRNELSAQRAACMTRADILKRYTVYVQRQAGKVSQVDDDETHYAWRREWREVQDKLEQERGALSGATYTYYPASDKLLGGLEASLASQRRAVEEAELVRSEGNRMSEGFAALVRHLYDVQLAAEYWRQQGAEDIYLYIQEELAKTEAIYNSRRRDYDNLSSQVRTQLATAIRLNRDIEREVYKLPDTLAADEMYTYREDLSARLARFNLSGALKRLLGASS